MKVSGAEERALLAEDSGDGVDGFKSDDLVEDDVSDKLADRQVRPCEVERRSDGVAKCSACMTRLDA